MDRLDLALVADGAAINRRTTGAGRVLHHVPCGDDVAQLGYKATGFVVLFGPKLF